MILLHRITPFFIGLSVAAGFGVMALLKGQWISLVLALVCWAVSVLLLARLVGWNVRSFQFWYLVGTPAVFSLSSYAAFLFLEHSAERVFLALLTALLVFFFSEHLFHYIHIPARYQAYAIEHLSLVLTVLTIFFLSSVGFGLQFLLQLPVAFLSLNFFLLSLFVIYGTLWVSKVDHGRAWPYAFAGAVLTTELFSVVTFLPTGFYTNAAVLALFFYLFLGFARAHFLDQLSRGVTQRYLLVGSVLLAMIVGTARWI